MLLILGMVENNAPLTAAERRERRLKRILGDGENRIKKILSGPDGGEQRLPPMMEGGDYKSFLSNGGEADDASESTASTSTWSSNPPSATGQCQLFSKIRQMDIPLSFAYGVLIRLFMLRWNTLNVFLPWFLLFFGARFRLFVQDGAHFVKDVRTALHLKDLTAVQGLMKRSRTFLFYFEQKDSVLTFLHDFTSRLVIMVAAFLVTHFILVFMYGT
ncbi:hypothetical protein GCK32_001147 [Trichostrongylus colubriformis]|uniref:Uncharacterized protein n=1 Tax=Trichostrongylus colubriformis TaxID=6319 RepID=A0AAN8G788_TRICO